MTGIDLQLLADEVMAEIGGQRIEQVVWKCAQRGDYLEFYSEDLEGVCNESIDVDRNGFLEHGGYGGISRRALTAIWAALDRQAAIIDANGAEQEGQGE